MYSLPVNRWNWLRIHNHALQNWDAGTLLLVVRWLQRYGIVHVPQSRWPRYLRRFNPSRHRLVERNDMLDYIKYHYEQTGAIPRR